jgi:hypothetical protein
MIDMWNKIQFSILKKGGNIFAEKQKIVTLHRNCAVKNNMMVLRK